MLTVCVTLCYADKCLQRRGWSSPSRCPHAPPGVHGSLPAHSEAAERERSMQRVWEDMQVVGINIDTVGSQLSQLHLSKHIDQQNTL